MSPGAWASTECKKPRELRVALDRGGLRGTDDQHRDHPRRRRRRGRRGRHQVRASTRVLPLIPKLLAALRAAARMQAEEQLAAGPPASAAATWSSTRWGGATTPTRCRTTGRPRVGKAGVKRIRLHDARHTCGTLMHLEHNVPVGWPPIWTRNTVEPMRTSGTGRDSLDG